MFTDFRFPISWYFYSIYHIKIIQKSKAPIVRGFLKKISKDFLFGNNNKNDKNISESLPNMTEIFGHTVGPVS